MQKRDLLGYGAATFADSGLYNFVTVYFLLFLTTCAQISPEIAGIITSIAILTDGLIGSIIGYISDNSNSSYGRRRPFIISSAAPMTIGLIFMFTVLPGNETIKAILYTIFGIMFWLGFSIYYVPYNALGAELTDDYNERSRLRSYSRIFGILGNFMGMALPLSLVEFLQRHGILESKCWFVVALMLALMACAGIIITWRTTKGKELIVEPTTDKMSIKSLVTEYVSILKLKPFKHMILVEGFYILAGTFYNSSMVFFTRYNLGIKDSVTSTVFLVLIVCNIICAPIMGTLLGKFEKKHVMAVSMMISGIAGIIFFLIGVNSYSALMVYVVFYSISYAAFWQIVNSIVYDITEVGEFVYGKRLEGSISSVYSITLTIFTSLATQILGWILKFKLYSLAFLLLPGIFLILAGIVQFLYPIDKAVFDKLKEAIKAKKDGKPVNIEELKKIV